jgi:hypothetical protein
MATACVVSPVRAALPSYLDGYDTGRRWFVSEDAREEEDA